MLVLGVHPVIMRIAAFCVVFSLDMFVSEAMEHHTEFAYSMIGQVIVLYVVVNVSLFHGSDSVKPVIRHCIIDKGV